MAEALRGWWHSLPKIKRRRASRQVRLKDLAQLPHFSDRVLISCGLAGHTKHAVNVAVDLLWPYIAPDGERPTIGARQAHGHDLVSGQLAA